MNIRWFISALLLVSGLTVGCQMQLSEEFLAAIQETPAQPARIAFMTDRDGDLEIYIMDQDGANLTNLTNDLAADGLPVWSSQAQAFAFITSRDASPLSIYRMNLDGSEASLISEDILVDPDIPLAWNESGTWLAFGGGPNADVYLIDPAGERLINLTDHPAQDNFEAWSPNGEHLLFTSDREGSLAIYTISVAGGEATRLTELESNNGEADWSPDGNRIAFMSDRDVDIEIYAMNADGSNVTRLTDSQGFDGFPAWSPNNHQIAFLSGRDGDAEVYVMGADGSEPTNLTNSPGSGESLQGDFAWSPDGSQILFHTDQDGDVEVYLMNADGGDQRNLTNHPATDLGSIWVGAE